MKEGMRAVEQSVCLSIWGQSLEIDRRIGKRTDTEQAHAHK